MGIFTKINIKERKLVMKIIEINEDGHLQFIPNLHQTINEFKLIIYWVILVCKNSFQAARDRHIQSNSNLQLNRFKLMEIERSFYCVYNITFTYIKFSFNVYVPAVSLIAAVILTTAINSIIFSCTILLFK